MELSELREVAKSKGVKNWYNMSEETLRAKLTQGDEQKIIINSQGLDLLSFFNVSLDFVEDVRVANGWDKIEYSPLRKAFKCFVGGDFVGSVSIEDILIKGGAK